MKIAYLTNQYPKVSHTFIRREIRALEDMGVEVSRFSIRETPDELVDPADIEEERRTRILLGGGAAPLLAATVQVAAQAPSAFARAAALAAEVGVRSERGPFVHGIYFAEACRLRGWLREVKADHIHVHFGTNPATVAMLCHALGGPSFSFTVHGPEEFDKPFLIRLQQKIERAAFVAAVSYFGRGQLLRQCEHAHWPKIHVVRCGVDEAFIRAEPAPIPEERRLLYIGRLSEQKGPLLLVEAAARVHAAGTAFELVLVGDGPMRGEVERLISLHRLEQVVKLVGWASGDAIQDWLTRSRALVLPSLAEGLPVVIMEALALGRPVLSTYIAGIPELVRPGECGWLVPSGSLDDLASALQVVLATPIPELERLGRLGRVRVLADHDVKTNAAHLCRLFEQAVAGAAMEPTAAPSPESMAREPEQRHSL